MMKVIWIVMLFLLIFLSFIAYIFIERGKDVSIDPYHSPIKEGNSIIEALEMYKNKNETYPVSLDELTPDYIYEIPRANWGTNFW